MANLARKFGPGILVTAAFIGPGTITTASIAGASYGYALMWALLFSIAATIILQEMAARLGLVTGEGLAEALRNAFSNHWAGALTTLLVISAIGIGNAAYEAGNIAGAALGLQGLTGTGGALWSLLVGALAGLLLASGQYRIIEKVLVLLVILMSLVFLLTLWMVKPSLSSMLAGLLAPTIPAGSLVTVLALIGTTVVPYNLFLHASAVKEKWRDEPNIDVALREARLDTSLSIGLGGLITLAVMSTSAAAFFGHSEGFTASNMAQQLEPLLGVYARYFFAAGLLAAGLSSAITAPLAAGYAVSGIMGWSGGMHSTGFKMVCYTVLLSGTAFAVLGTRPLTAILFAQAANGFLLPICAIFLLVVMNRRNILGDYRNSIASNVFGCLVVLITVGLGLLKIARVLGLSV